MDKKAVAVYVRVSTSKQDVASQMPDLKAWVAVHAKGRTVAWYRDQFTGATLKRPGMQKLEAAVHSGKVGTIVVWRLDRLGRSAAQMLTFLEELDVAGVRFVSLKDGVDASSPAGRLMRNMLVSFAEYERELIRERIMAGIDKAKADGKRWGGRKAGHRTRLTPEKVKAIGALLKEGTGKAEIARQLGISERSVYRAMEML